MRCAKKASMIRVISVIRTGVARSMCCTRNLAQVAFAWLGHACRPTGTRNHCCRNASDLRDQCIRHGNHDSFDATATARSPRASYRQRRKYYASLALTSDPESLFARANNSLAYVSSKSTVTMLTLQYANAFRRDSAHVHIKINAATPSYIATDLNNHSGPRTVEQCARIIVELAILSDDGSSGVFFNDDGHVPWS